ncbi:disease resistance protein [Salix suchowensis]|nr:disease resistance protein [Salix suchowensis]
MKCKFCGHLFAKGTSISRIKWHLSGETGHGVDICGQVPKEDQEAAFLAMRGGNKRHKSISSSSNVNDYAIPTCPQEQDNAGDAGRIQVGVQGMENTGEGSFQHVDRRVSLLRLRVDAHENRGEAAQGTDVVAQIAGGIWHQIFSEAQKLNEINLMLEEEDEEPGAGARSSRILKDNTSETRGVLFPTSSNKPVGQAFEENRDVIWSLLKNDEVSTIGIYGMGGVGKTTLLQHIYNELLRTPDICDHIWWVTVSQDFSISALQNLIDERVDLDLSRDLDDKHRAAKLSKELRKKQKWILILDDLWNSFELHDVGIHSSLKGCKLILTTRSQTVCAQIDCQHKIQVKPLFEGESWTLFKENLRRHTTLSDEVEGIAKAVAMECAGLPLGIITIARSLRGVDDLPEWRTTLMKLRELKFRDMDEKVFKVLRVSYDRLDDGLALKQCLLYCALYPEDHMIERKKLIGYLIDEGIIKGRRRRQDAFDEGHTMLNRLQYVCLLDGGRRCVKMHDLIRDMAIQILQENSQVIVKAGAQLEEMPDAEEWTENLTRVSLMKNKIKKLPSSYSPMCPNLSTLLLCQNHQLVFIADSFFKQMHGLKVLNLSKTGIEKLPESVSDLVSLIALLLNDCRQLRYVPSLEKLSALKSLDLYRTSLEKMPLGMECLSNLRFFRINGCGENEFPSGILPKLSHLQVLALGVPYTKCYTVEGMEVGCLGNLETLECHFKGLSDFMEYLTSRDGIQSLSTYKILVGTLKRDFWYDIEDLPCKTVRLVNLSINRDRDFQVKLLNGIQGLRCEIIDVRSLCDIFSLENATELEIIRIAYCDRMESLVSSSWFCSATLPLPSHNGMFSHLREFWCSGCSSMKKLFPLELLPYLINLEVINVLGCEKMEEIIGTTDEESNTSNPIAELTLPKLTILDLFGLPELKVICRAKLICNSLEIINIKNCENLKRIPISLPLLENGQPSPHPSLERIEVLPEEWWETVVEWEPPNAKEVLRPIVHFWGVFDEYRRPLPGFFFKYFTTRRAASQCGILGSCINWLRILTEYVMSGLVIVREIKRPTSLL